MRTLRTTTKSARLATAKPNTSRRTTASTAIRAEEATVLIKRSERQARRGALITSLQVRDDGRIDRRSFLRKSGLVAGSLATLGALPLAGMRKAEAGPPPA